tara:strand:+ start:942 stop:2045 length:1104 start_codon:yes stop_codon:yes gene_type:complete
MRNLVLVFLFLSPLLYGDELADILQRIEQEYNENEPNFEAVREEVGLLNKSIDQMTYPLKKKVGWWDQPSGKLVVKLEEIADTLAPYEEMLINLANYRGIQQGYASTLTTLLNARPSENLRDRLGNYLFGNYSKGVPERSLLVLYTLNLADDRLYERLFQGIRDQEKYRSQDFRTLRLLASRNDPVPGFADALLNLIKERIETVSNKDSRGILELSDIAKAYSKMIDGMGAGMLPVASELGDLVFEIMNSPHKEEVLAIYPNFEGYIKSIIGRIKENQRIAVPLRGYGLVLNQNKFPPSDPEVVEVDDQPAALEKNIEPEPSVKELTEAERVEAVEEAPAESSRWWLWLIGLLVVVGGLGLMFRRKN